MEAKKEIIIFGGSFNPPTLAHQAIMKKCLEQPGYDEVWVMPSGDRIDKEITASDAERLAMLHQVKGEVFAGNERLHVSDFELNLSRPTQTIRTLGALATAYPDVHFWFVYGADSYASMATWQSGDRLQREMSCLLMARAGYRLPPETMRVRHLPAMEDCLVGMSSTVVRERLARREAVKDLVCRSVMSYIQERKLYQTA